MISRNGRNRALQRRSLKKPGNMIGGPTVVPIDGYQQAIPQVSTDPYVAIEIDTTALAVATQVVLFDASRGWQLANSYAMPVDLVIRGITADYQFILNDLTHNASYFDIIKQQINDDAVALIQYSHPFEVYDSSKGSKPKLLKTIYPDMGVHEGQFQKGINTFSAPTLITNRTALVFTMEPGIRMVLGFYQKAEIGRKQ